MAHTEPIRDPKQVKALLAHYRKLGQYRNNLLLSIGVHTALRISDILSLTTDKVYDFKNRQVHKSITVTEMKTGKSKTIALNKRVCDALMLYFPEAVPNTPLFFNKATGRAISRMQANRIIGGGAKSVGIANNVSGHSLRKTFGYHSWKEGVSPAIIMEIYNHSSLATTRRYLGVSQDDLNTVYMSMVF